jgi:hypothetical protein
MSPFLRFIDGMKTEIGQGIYTFSGNQEEASPIASAATVRASARNPTFPPEADTAIAAFSCSEGDFDLVDEHIERSANLLGRDD